MAVKLICAFLFVVVLTYVYAELDIDKLEIDLQNSDWTEEHIDMDNSDEKLGRIGKEETTCSCMDYSSCGCCIKPRIFGMKFPVCLNATLLLTETKNIEILQFTANLLERHVSEFNFNIEPYNKMCKIMPVMKFLSICLYNNNTSSDENGLVTCSSMDLVVRKTSAASLKLSCLQFKNNKVSFFDNKNSGRNFISSWISLKIKSPLQRVVEHVKKNNLMG